MAAPAKDYIGFDPIAWVERLKDVAAGSQFTAEEKETIRVRLGALRLELIAKK